jgi:two-component system CheB/CheR fusion protein
VLELTRANNDMNNLLAGTGVGTVFVDLKQRVLRFTPATTAIINLIPGDLGRPLAHIASNLVGYDHLLVDVTTVLRTLVPHTAEVQASDGRWYTMRVQPYRTLDNVIEGAVITFEDITALKQTEATLRAAAADLRRLAVVVKDARDAITVQDLEGRVQAWNPAAARIYGWTEAEALRMNIADLVPPALREEAVARMKRLADAGILEPYRTQRITKDGTVLDVSVISTPLVDETGQAYAIATTERVS